MRKLDGDPEFITFTQLEEKSKESKAQLFMNVLHLMNEGKVKLEQANPEEYSEIEIAKLD